MLTLLRCRQSVQRPVGAYLNARRLRLTSGQADMDYSCRSDCTKRAILSGRMFGCDHHFPAHESGGRVGKQLFSDVYEMALLSHIPHHP